VADIQSDKADSPARETAGTRLAAKRAAKAAQKAAARNANANANASGTTEPNADDAVPSTALEATAWLDKHGRTLLYVVGGAIAVAVGGLLLSNVGEGKNREAGSLLQTAVTTSLGIVVPAEETPPEDPLFPVFPSAKERDEKALSQYRDVAKKFPDSLAASYAQLGDANIQLGLGNFVDASTIFEKLKSAPKADDFIRARALEGAGYALEGQKQYAQARERFEALSQLKNGAYRTLADYHRARMLVAEGKRDDAKKLLEELTKAASEKPSETPTGKVAEEGASTDRYESALNAAQTLLTELGGTLPERAGGTSGISQQVLDSLRKQMGAKSGAGQ
jgi:tetratricopeptide (TPR) repeat protein